MKSDLADISILDSICPLGAKFGCAVNNKHWIITLEYFLFLSHFPIIVWSIQLSNYWINCFLWCLVVYPFCHTKLMLFSFTIFLNFFCFFFCFFFQFECIKTKFRGRVTNAMIIYYIIRYLWLNFLKSGLNCFVKVSLSSLDSGYSVNKNCSRLTSFLSSILSLLFEVYSSLCNLLLCCLLADIKELNLPSKAYGISISVSTEFTKILLDKLGLVMELMLFTLMMLEVFSFNCFFSGKMSARWIIESWYL